MLERRAAAFDPEWLDRSLYPFEDHYIDVDEGCLHYVDEGRGEPILFVHGNPTWSFLYRRLIDALRGSHRCIAPDQLGFGLSKTNNYRLGPEAHAANLTALIEHLELKNITLVIHDWGGPIGMRYAVDHPDRIVRLIVFDTTVWSLKNVPEARRFARFVGSPVGRFLCRRANLFPRFVMPRLFGHRSKLTKDIHGQYLGPFKKVAARDVTWRMVTSLIDSSDWMESIWARRSNLADKPVLIMAGGEDPSFGGGKLRKWQEAFPSARTHYYPNVGHFVPEELGEAAVDPVRAFLED